MHKQIVDEKFLFKFSEGATQTSEKLKILYKESAIKKKATYK